MEAQRLRSRAIDWATIGRLDTSATKRWVLERIAGEGNEGMATSDLHAELNGLRTAAGLQALSLNVLSYHVQGLVSLGRLEESGVEHVRGAVKKSYRVCEAVLLSGQQEASARLQASATRLAVPPERTFTLGQVEQIMGWYAGGAGRDAVAPAIAALDIGGLWDA